MSEKRTLTDAEKTHVASMQLTIERLKNPGRHIDITVYDETDDEGQARVLAVKQNEAVLSPDWKSPRQSSNENGLIAGTT